MSNPLTELTRARLALVSTATLSTILLRYNLRNQYVQGAQLLGGGDRHMVGPAFTLRYIPAREDLDTPEAFQDPTHPQRLAIETIPPGHVLVMDCRGDASAASAGSILLTRLQVRGCAGVVSDAGIRDAQGTGKLSMPVFCSGPSAPTNLTKHHAIDINVPIGCGTVAVFPGDIMVGDGDGVMVIPSRLADEVAEIAEGMEAYEAFVLEEVLAGRSVIGTYPPNDDARQRYADYQAGRYTPGQG